MADPNRWCTDLGIDPPRLETFPGLSALAFRDLLVLTLLEAGRSLTLPGIAARVGDLGRTSPCGNMELTLGRVWRGMKGISRDDDGRLALDPDSPDMQHFVHRLRLGGNAGQGTVHSSLTADEVRAALSSGYVSSLSRVRIAGAILDAAGEALDIDQVRVRLAAICPRPPDLDEAHFSPTRHWMVALDEAGLLRLDPDHPHVPGMRRAIRAKARPVLAREEEKRWRRERERLARPREQEEATRRRGRADELRRAIVRVLPDAETPFLAGLLDCETGQIRTWPWSQAAAAKRALAAYDVLAGIGIRETVTCLGRDPDDFLARELSPPRNEVKLNPAGRVLTLTPESIITCSTGISRPFGAPKRIAGHISRGSIAPLVKRLESDLGAVHALYRYGVLHGCVRIHPGFPRLVLGVAWAEPGDAGILELCREARMADRELEVVVRTGPSVPSSWPPGHRVEPVIFKQTLVGFVDLETGERFDLREVQAVRIV